MTLHGIATSIALNCTSPIGFLSRIKSVESMHGPDNVSNFKKPALSSLTTVPVLSRMAVTGTYPIFFFFATFFSTVKGDLI